MTTSTVQPGMRAVMASPFTPIAVINGTPIYALQGGRSGGGIRIAAGPDDGEDPDEDEDDEDDGEDEGDDEGEELPAVMRGKPKKATRRAAPADEDDEPDEDEDEDGDDTPGAIQRMEAALAKANKTAMRHRRAGRAMQRLGIDDLDTWLTERGIDPETGRPFGSDVVDPDDEVDEADDSLFEERPARRDQVKTDKETTRAIRAAEKRAEAKVRAELVPILAQVSATNALRNAGFKGTEAKLERMLRLIDPDDLDVIVEDGTFEIEGLDEAVATVKDEFPELFPDAEPVRTRTTGTGRARPAARRVSGARDVDGDGRGRAAKKAQSGGWLDQMAARMDRNGR